VAGFPVRSLNRSVAVGCHEAILDDRSLVMALPSSAADFLDERVTLEIESINRMYLNVYMPPLQYTPVG
jgi:hypothetical protein